MEWFCELLGKVFYGKNVKFTIEMQYLNIYQ